jgi:hypothetical protein
MVRYGIAAPRERPSLFSGIDEQTLRRALDESGWNWRVAARKLHVPSTALRAWAKRDLPHLFSGAHEPAAHARPNPARRARRR